MRLFGYYAVHAFWNQLRKLFKTWVMVFILICGLMGGLIGFGATTISDMAEADVPEEVMEEVDEGFTLPIETDELIELIAGGVLLAVFLFEAFSADKNGSKIFLPADVNLLFSSPMQPQSVLMFRLATQLGTAVAATIYMGFQIPNLMLNLDVSGWTCAALLITWFFAILVGKLLQVLLYTYCSSHAGFKDILRNLLYAVCFLIGGGFLVYWKFSNMEPLVAASRFFNTPFSRWIPFWGWLKALCLYASQQRLALSCLCLLASVLGCAALVFCIRRIDADFYEDAMAKSEETAALMEKARSEKSTGVTATRQRKKERKSTLRRDGLQKGWGANVFFYKTMYNRFRFAQFGFFTKTMETYLAAALGMGLVIRFGLIPGGEIPVALTLGGLVFFRAIGNPLEEDTGMDFFRLIPESTWMKLLYSLLGGTVNCLIDVAVPMLAASALLAVNPVKLLIWLPVIVSVDFYATSVGAFIDLSVPITAGKMIKQFIQILFIYFGLLPDIAIMAIGIVLEHTLLAAVISTTLNVALGFLFFSLASIYLEPKGKEHTVSASYVDLKAAKKQFSRMGFAVFGYLAITTVVQIVMGYASETWLSGLTSNPWGIWIVTFAPQYLVAVPLTLLLLKKVPAQKPEAKPLGFQRGIKFLFISIFMMYGGNLVGNLITAAIGGVKGASVENPLMTYLTGENMAAQILFPVILAPIFEELIFRKALIDRMRPYGGKTAVVLSALMFGLFHGNLSQFFYAFGLGLVFGYIYLNTGRIRNTMIAHMIINFFGGIFATFLLDHLPMDALESGEFTAELLKSPWVLGYAGYVLLLVGGALAGFVLLCMNWQKLTFPQGIMELKRKDRITVTCCNIGMILFTLGCLAMVVLSIAL